MDNITVSLEDLPPEIEARIDALNAEIAEIRETIQTQVAGIREKADQKIEKLTSQGEDKIQALVEKAIAELKPQQTKYLLEGKLDEALAIREHIKQLQRQQHAAQPDPGHLAEYSSQIGQSFNFDVTGHPSGTVWGTDVYTTDSILATAAVHAGKVGIGERKVVRVTIVQAPSSFQGTTRNGVTTHSYGPYPAAYRFG